MKVRTIAISGAISLLIGLTGFFRDKIVAQTFGVGAETDAFFLALAWPVFMVGIFETFATRGFMPRFIRNTVSGKTVGQALITIHACIGLLFILACSIFSFWTPILLGNMINILLPIVLMAAFFSIWSAMLQAHQHYLYIGALQIFPPLTAILFIIIGADSLGIQSAAYGIVCGYALVFLCAAIKLHVKGDIIWPRWPTMNSEIRAVIQQYRSLIAGVVLMATNPIIDRVMAAFYGAGETSELVLGGRVTGFVLSLIGTAISAIVLGELSRIYAMGNKDRFLLQAKYCERWLISTGLAISILIATISPQIIDLIFASDKIMPDDLNTINLVQIASLLQIPFYLGGLVWVHVLSATDQNHIITKVAVSNFILNILLNIVFGYFYGAIGIAAATSVVYLYSYTRLKIIMSERLHHGT